MWSDLFLFRALALLGDYYYFFFFYMRRSSYSILIRVLWGDYFLYILSSVRMKVEEGIPEQDLSLSWFSSGNGL